MSMRAKECFQELSVYKDEQGTWSMHLHGVRIMVFNGDVFVRRVLSPEDVARLQTKQVKLLPGDNRVLVY